MSKESAEVLRKFMHIRSISIAEFAKVTDVSRFSIYRYLKGSPVSRKVALRIEEKVLQTYRTLLPHEKLIY